eukprot:superscaffoldBa00000469_g4941
MEAMVFFKSLLHHTFPSDTPISSSLLTPLIIPPRTPLMLSLPSSPGTFFPPLSVCIPSIVTIFSLRLLCLSLLGDLCVRADRDILYLSYLFPWENWCVMLTWDDGQRCLEITHLKREGGSTLTIDDAPVETTGTGRLPDLIKLKDIQTDRLGEASDPLRFNLFGSITAGCSLVDIG